MSLSRHKFLEEAVGLSWGQLQGDDCITVETWKETSPLCLLKRAGRRIDTSIMDVHTIPSACVVKRRGLEEDRLLDMHVCQTCGPPEPCKFSKVEGSLVTSPGVRL